MRSSAPSVPEDLQPTPALTPRWQDKDLDWQLMYLLGALMFVMLLTIGTIISIYAVRTDRANWRGLQTKEAQHTGEIVGLRIQQIRDTLQLVAQAAPLDPEAGSVAAAALGLHPEILELLWISADGGTISHAHQGPPLWAEGADAIRADWFQVAGSGHPYLGDVQLSDRVEPYLVMAEPAPQGGAIAARLRLSAMSDLVSEIEFGRHGHAFLIDGHGCIIAHRDPEIVLLRTSIAERPEAQELLTAPSYETRGSYENLAGTRVFGIGAPITGTDWLVITELPAIEVYRRGLLGLLLVEGGMAALGSLAIRIERRAIKRVLVGPMQALRDGALRIGRGELDVRIPIESRNEIGIVAAAFNDMANQLHERDKTLAEQAAELRKSHEELEQRVEERTAELVEANETLQHEIKARAAAENELQRYSSELERSNTELSYFAYIASHDLQEPLRMVTSYVQLLASRYQGKLDSDADDFINFAVDGAARMQALIKGLLAYSRVGTRGKEMVPTDTQLIVDHALMDLRIAIEETEALVTRDSLPTVMGDASQLGQLFQNLIGNALKFRGEERPRIHIGAEQRDGKWVFSVSDNGIGIEDKYFERIFQIFQRLHTMDEYPGAGIGLAVCKRIVERHGGRIWVESTPGNGSSFYFTMNEAGRNTK